MKRRTVRLPDQPANGGAKQAQARQATPPSEQRTRQNAAQVRAARRQRAYGPKGQSNKPS
eukprot:2230972-Pyramimonas_sp.AAC.2